MAVSVPRKTACWRLLFVMALVAACGCSSFDLRQTLHLPGHEPKLPEWIVDVWSDGVLSEPGMTPIRGFGGRIMFYGSQDKKPMMVDGTFTVFAFDEADRDTGYTVPEKKFVYLPEQLPKYYSKSELGHSYSFWLPWDEVGGPERRITLVAKFEPKKGPAILSKPCTKTLPGTKTRGGRPRDSVRVTTRSEPAGVRTVSHEEPILTQSPREQMTIFTLDVPSSLARPDAAPPPDKPAAAGDAAGKRTDTAAPGSTAAPSGASPDHPPDGARSAAPREEPQPASAPEASPSARFAPRRFPAQRGAIARSRPDPVRRQPRPAMWQSALPPTPRSDWPGETPGSPSTSGLAPH
jgi:hypothetical protein